MPIIWRVKHLRKRLEGGPVSAIHAAWYVAVVLAFIQVARLLPPTKGSVVPPQWRYAEHWMDFLIYLAGIAAAYWANGGRTGRDFAARFAAMVAVVGIRVFVLALVPTAFVAAVINWQLRIPGLDAAMSVLCSLALEALLLWRVTVHLLLVARNERAQ